MERSLSVHVDKNASFGLLTSPNVQVQLKCNVPEAGSAYVLRGRGQEMHVFCWTPYKELF